MAQTGVNADRHAQLDRPDGALLSTDLLDRPLHVRRGAGGPLGVAVAEEEEEERVAAELEHVTTVPLGHGDQIVEDRRDPLHELLGAGLAVDGESLGQSGEPGDIDRDEGGVDLASARRAGSSLQRRTSRGRYGASTDDGDGISVTPSALLFGRATTNGDHGESKW